MTTKKLSGTPRRDASGAGAVVARRGRTHTIVPEHLGEAGSVATLAMAILGVALFIAALAIIVSGLTTANRYTGATPPPGVEALGTGQVLGGVGLLLLGTMQATSALLLLARVRGSRRVLIAVAAVSALLAVIGVLLATQQHSGVLLMGGTLTVAALIYAATAVILARPYLRP